MISCIVHLPTIVVSTGFGNKTLTVDKGYDFFTMCVVLSGEAAQDASVKLISVAGSATPKDGKVSVQF